MEIATIDRPDRAGRKISAGTIYRFAQVFVWQWSQRTSVSLLQRTESRWSSHQKRRVKNLIKGKENEQSER